MVKKNIFEDFREEGVFDTFEKHKQMDDAIFSAVHHMNRMIELGYKIDFFQIEPEDLDGKPGFHIRVTGDRFGKG